MRVVILLGCLALTLQGQSIIPNGTGNGGSGSSGLPIQDNGTPAGTATTLNCVSGLGVACAITPSSGTGTKAQTLNWDRGSSVGNEVVCIPASASSSAFACTATGGVDLTATTGRQVIFFKPDVTSAATPTLNINGGGAVTITNAFGNAIAAADLAAGAWYTLVWDGTKLQAQGVPAAATAWSYLLNPDAAQYTGGGASGGTMTTFTNSASTGVWLIDRNPNYDGTLKVNLGLNYDGNPGAGLIMSIEVSTACPAINSAVGAALGQFGSVSFGTPVQLDWTSAASGVILNGGTQTASFTLTCAAGRNLYVKASRVTTDTYTGVVGFTISLGK